MAPSRYLFDRWGTCFGHVDDTGRYFDAHGYHIGNVAGGGEVLGRDGSPRGRIDVQGQFWNQQGLSIGYLGPRVRIESGHHSRPRASAASGSGKRLAH